MEIAVREPGIIKERAAQGLRGGLLQHADLRNMLWLLVGFGVVVLLVSPVRAFPIVDDWAYARSAENLLHGVLPPHDWSEANSFAHTGWGAVFILLFGNSFTSLTLATLAASAGCLLAFYLLLRNLDISPSGSFWGTACLGFNPLYLFLSYSFMTDVTFLFYMLLACLCYVRGFKGYGTGWLWAGSGLCALAFLTRQFGVVVAVAALLYLWLSRSWSWKKALAIALLPALAFGSYSIWDSTLSTRLVQHAVDDMHQYIMLHPVEYILWRAQNLVWALSVIGLCLLPVARMPRRVVLGLPVLAFMLYFQLQSIHQFGSIYPQNGSIVDQTGFIIYHYNAAPLWAPWVWALLGILGSVVVTFYSASLIEQAWSWLRARRWQEQATDPVLVVYLLGLMILGLVLFLTPSLFDRYFLPLLPVAILLALRARERQSPTEGTLPARLILKPWMGRLAWLSLVPIALFSVIGERDFVEHSSVRWQAAEQLAVQGIARNRIDAGYDWAGWYLYDEGAAYIRSEGLTSHIPFPGYALLDSQYMISDTAVDGYSKVGSLPYGSWLEGGQTRYVLVLKRN